MADSMWSEEGAFEVRDRGPSREFRFGKQLKVKCNQARAVWRSESSQRRTSVPIFPLRTIATIF